MSAFRPVAPSLGCAARIGRLAPLGRAGARHARRAAGRRSCGTAGLRTNGWNDDSKPTSTEAGLPATCGTSQAPLTVGGHRPVDPVTPPVRSEVDRQHLEGHRDAGVARDPAIQSNSVGGVGHVARHREDAVAGAAHRRADRDELVGRGGRAGGQLAVLRSVQHRAGRRDAHRAGHGGLFRRCRAISSISPGVASSFGRALTEHVGPQRAVRQQGGDVEHPWHATRARRGTRGTTPSSTTCPRASAAPGMSSTPSISWIRKSCSSGRAGAKPTPQLPITTVVTPCQPDGETSGPTSPDRRSACACRPNRG